MRKIHFAILALTSLAIASCSKKETVTPPLTATTNTISIGSIDLKASFGVYAQANKGITTNAVNNTNAVTATNATSTWRQMLGGVSTIQFKLHADGSVVSDSLFMNNAAYYIKTLKTGIYDITFASKSTAVADSFIRFTATNLNYNLVSDGAINFSATTTDGVITIAPGYVKQNTIPTFKTADGKTYNFTNFFSDGNYWFIYVKNGTAGTLSLTESTTGQVLTQSITVSQNNQYNVVVQPQTNSVKGLTLSFAAFNLVNISMTYPGTTITYSGTSIVSSFAGDYNKPASNVNGATSVARFSNISGTCINSKGDIFISETSDYNDIRKISGGQVSTLAGSSQNGASDGKGTAATFSYPSFITCDAADNLYVFDRKNYKIRKITPDGVVTTIAGGGSGNAVDGPALSASFADVYAMCAAPDGTLYIGELNRIRMLKNGAVTTIAGGSKSGIADGSGANAGFGAINALTYDTSGFLWVGDVNLLRIVDSNNDVMTIAGKISSSTSTTYSDGTGQTAVLGPIKGLAVDRKNGAVYFTDAYANRIRKYVNGNVTTLVGTGAIGGVDGNANASTFYSLNYLAMNSDLASLYVIDNNTKVRLVSVVR